MQRRDALMACLGTFDSSDAAHRILRRGENVQRGVFARAFSLIELIVVIALISILIALFLPSLASARRSAQTVPCVSNLRQIGQAIYMYANANNGDLPDWTGIHSYPNDPFAQGFWLTIRPSLKARVPSLDGVIYCLGRPGMDKGGGPINADGKINKHHMSAKRDILGIEEAFWT